MFGFTENIDKRATALGRLRAWTRARFALADDTTVMATELQCGLPGCPPLETHVAFWTERGRHHFKVFKPAAEVIEDDLPPAFMKNALVADEDDGCC